ncbi:hypothetical protein Tco_0520216 [Tanacetum coccineum]
MESIRRNFFKWYSADGEKKLARVSWSKFLRSKKLMESWSLQLLDDMLLPKSDVPSRWVKQIPIKVNVLAWKISMDRLPTRVNLHRRGVQKCWATINNSIRDPTAKKTTRGRPSGRKTHIEPPKPSNSSLPKQATHAYINQFPRMFDAFIDRVQDVKADGNRGFRVTAVGLRLHEDEWPTIRYRLMQELDMHRQQYVSMFGADGYNHVRDHLDFFNIDECAPMIK